MRSNRSGLLLRAPLLAPFVLAVAAAAQATHLVGPNGMTSIPAALLVAQDGDRIHIEPGTYPAFHCSVGVSIRALQPGTVTIVDVARTRFELNPAQTVDLTDLHFGSGVQIDFGRVTLTGCSITGQGYACYAHDAALHFVDCGVQLTGLGIYHTAALRVDDCHVTAIGSTFAGGTTTFGAIGDGIAAWGSQLHLGNVTLHGDAQFGIGGGLNALDSSVVWLTDSTASSTYSCPIRASLGGVVYVDGVTTIGAGGNDCGTTTARSMLAVSQPGPLLAGAPFQLDYRGEPNGLLVVFAAPSLATHLVPGLLDQPSWLEPTQSFAAGLAVLDGSGHATMSWNVPGGPAIPDLSLWFKGISGLSFPLQVAPVAGGVARG